MWNEVSSHSSGLVLSLWENNAKQKKLREEQDQAESEASSDEASTDLDQAAGDQNASRKDSLAEKAASSNSPGIFGTLVNAITGFIAAIFRAVFAVVYYLIVVPVKFLIYLTYGLGWLTAMELEHGLKVCVERDEK